MSEPHRAGVQRGRRARADVRQALLRSGFAHLYPGIPPEEWQPAAVMTSLVVTLRSGAPQNSTQPRHRVLDEKHFVFRGRLSAGAQDDQRRSRLEDRRDRRSRADSETA
jgi:hypothetical protein